MVDVRDGKRQEWLREWEVRRVRELTDFGREWNEMDDNRENAKQLVEVVAATVMVVAFVLVLVGFALLATM